ncbi:MAG: cytochrome c biogenesis CcdA family protein [Xanthobacteraceae bacterium]
MLNTILALLAGTLTVAAPCTLPVLPILLGASVAQTSKARPLLIALGFVTSFSCVALTFSAIDQILGVDQNTLRAVAIPILLGFGLLLLWPKPFEWLIACARLLDRTGRSESQIPGGNIGGFLLGTTLGLVWTPCAGPVLGSILTIIATSPHLQIQAFLLVAYAIGAAVPMLAIAYGGQFVTARVKSVARISHRLQQGFGVLVIVFAVAMYFQYDTLITAWVSGFYPNGQIGL